MNLCIQAKLNIILYLFSHIIFYLLSWVTASSTNYKNFSFYCLTGPSCGYSEKLMVVSIELVVLILLTWIINWLCKINYNVLAWILVFVPFILSMLSIVFLSTIVSSNPELLIVASNPELVPNE